MRPGRIARGKQRREKVSFTQEKPDCGPPDRSNTANGPGVARRRPPKEESENCKPNAPTKRKRTPARPPRLAMARKPGQAYKGPSTLIQIVQTVLSCTRWRLPVRMASFPHVSRAGIPPGPPEPAKTKPENKKRPTGAVSRGFLPNDTGRRSQKLYRVR